MEKFDRVHKTPDYRVDLLTGARCYGKWMLGHIGCYLDPWRGPKSYADVSDGESIYRVILPKKYFEKIEKMSHDCKTMNNIHDGKCSIEFERYQPEHCPASMTVTIRKDGKAI